MTGTRDDESLRGTLLLEVTAFDLLLSATMSGSSIDTLIPFSSAPRFGLTRGRRISADVVFQKMFAALQ